MIKQEPISLINTGMPLALLVVGAMVIPRGICGKATLSQRRVIVAVLLSAVCLIILGAILFAAIYGLQGSQIGAAFTQGRLATCLFFLQLSLKLSLVWVPVLLLVWFGMAQGVERRRGDALVNRGEA